MKLKYRLAEALGYDVVRARRNLQPPIRRHIAQVLAAHDVNCVIDTGANVGQYSRDLRQAGYRGRIVSFEPQEGPYAELVAAAAADEDWSTHRLALGREDGEAVLYDCGRSQLASLHRPASLLYQRVRAATAAHEQRVPLARLDRLFDELVAGLDAPRVFLKMDTQGSDLDVFAGASGCLDRIVGLQSELSVLPLYEGMPDYMTALATYRAAGFEVTGFFPVFRIQPELVLGEVDCVLVRHVRRPPVARPG